MMNILNKYKNLSNPVKAGTWFTACNVFQRGIQFLVVPVYTRILSAEGYGMYSLFITWMNVMSVFATLNLSGGAYFNGLLNFEKERTEFTSSLIFLGTLSSLFFLIILLFLYPFIDNFVGLPFHLLLVMFLSIIVSPALHFWTYQQQIEYKYRRLVIVTAILSLLTPLIGLFCVLYLHMGYEGVIYGFVIANALVCGWFYVSLLFKGRILYRKKYWHYALVISVPLIPHYLSQMVLGQSDRVMIQYYCGAYYTGIYSLAYQVSLIMNLVISGINFALTPWMYNNLKIHEYGRIRTSSLQLIIFVATLSVIAMLVAPEIIRILGTEEYLQAVWVIPPVIFSTCITFIYCIYGTVLFYYERTKLVAIATTSGAILNIALNIVFIPRYGFLSAAYTTLVGYFVMYLMYKYYTSKILKQEKLLFKELFDVPHIRMIIITLWAMSLLSTILFSLPNLIRYFILLLISITVYWQRKRIKQTMFQLRL